MNLSYILSKCDHTLLSQNATWNEIKATIDDAIEFKAASVCIPPAYVKRAREYACGRTKICTVIGFPNGYSTTEVKVFETADAVKNGADEIDMVINIAMLKDGHFDELLNEIKAIRTACDGLVLKVIIEACLLSEEEKIKMCEIVSLSDADYIKTSTGFAGGGATAEDVALLHAHVTNGTMVKAAGGISSLADAEKFIELGAERLGTSRIIKIAKNQKGTEY